MHSRTIAGLFALGALIASGAALGDAVAFPIEYPLTRYRIRAESPDMEGRAKDLAALRQRLASTLSAGLTESPDRGGGTSVVTGLPLNRAVRPIRILWNDPRYLLRAPVVVEWVELVDERGRVTRVWVTASNVGPRDDEAIIGWCTSEALGHPIEVEGRTSFTLRTAGVTLVGSPFHYTYWTQKLRTKSGLAVAVALFALVLWLIARVATFRRDRELQQAQLKARLHRTTPYKAPSIDD